MNPQSLFLPFLVWQHQDQRYTTSFLLKNLVFSRRVFPQCAQCTTTLWYTGKLSRVYPASCPMTTGVHFSPQWLVMQKNGWTELQIISLKIKRLNYHKNIQRIDIVYSKYHIITAQKIKETILTFSFNYTRAIPQRIRKHTYTSVGRRARMCLKRISLYNVSDRIDKQRSICWALNATLGGEVKAGHWEARAVILCVWK